MASNYEKYLHVLAQSFKEVFVEMTKKRTDSHVVRGGRERIRDDFVVGVIVPYRDRKSNQKGQCLLGLTDQKKAVRLASTMLASRGEPDISEFSELAVATLQTFIETVVDRTRADRKRSKLPLVFGTPQVLDAEQSPAALTVARETHMITLGISGETIALFVTFEETAENVLSGKKILVADDSRMIRAILTRAFEKRGCVVVEAVDGRDAVEKFHAEAPALTVMDIVMPNMDGLGAIVKIREAAPHAKVLVLTATASKNEVVTAASLGVSGYLRKPVKPEMLMETAADCLK